MGTMLDIDEKAPEEAMAVVDDKTKTAVITEALREYACRRRARKLLDLRGKAPWQGDLDALRKRAPRRA